MLSVLVSCNGSSLEVVARREMVWRSCTCAPMRWHLGRRLRVRLLVLESRALRCVECFLRRLRHQSLLYRGILHLESVLCFFFIHLHSVRVPRHFRQLQVANRRLESGVDRLILLLVDKLPAWGVRLPRHGSDEVALIHHCNQVLIRRRGLGSCRGLLLWLVPHGLIKHLPQCLVLAADPDLCHQFLLVAD